MKTFLKWAGNKTSVVDKIAPFLIGDTLIEPFAGSCAVSLNSSFNNYICNDINEDMINMFKLVQNIPHDYITKVKEYFNNGNDSDKYYELRKLYNQTTDKNIKSEVFLYLNRHCFNGLCRYNKKGEFNTPFGSYTSPYFPEKEILDFHNYTKNNFEFLCEDFSNVFLRADKNTVIYCDPPYLKLTDTADFSNYAKGGFSLKNHLHLRDLAIQYSNEINCTVIISNHDTNEIRDLYKDANEIVSFNVKRTISSKATNRTQAPELLAIYRV
jgi:DNA adenine methylase